MALLPSQRNAHVHPPKHSILQRRSTFPFFESTRMSTPDESGTHTPPDYTPSAIAVSDPSVLAAAELAPMKTRPPTPSPRRRPGVPSSNPSFLSLAGNRQEETEHHIGISPERRLCPSAYTVTPVIDFSRPRLSSAALSAPSVIAEPQKRTRTKRVRRRLKKPVSSRKDSDEFPKQVEREPRKVRPWKLDWSRSTSEEALQECTRSQHTLEPAQDLLPAKSPFLKELTGFLANRAGKWILPSRVSESGSYKDTRQSDSVAACPQCGHELPAGDVCERCQSRVDVPGGWT